MLQGGAPSTKGKRKVSAAAAEENEVDVVGVVRRQGTPDDPMVLDADPEPADVSTPPNQAAEETQQDRIASANAYMLVYRRQSHHGGARRIELPAKYVRLLWNLYMLSCRILVGCTCSLSAYAPCLGRKSLQLL